MTTSRSLSDISFLLTCVTTISISFLLLGDIQLPNKVKEAMQMQVGDKNSGKITECKIDEALF